MLPQLIQNRPYNWLFSAILMPTHVLFCRWVWLLRVGELIITAAHQSHSAHNNSLDILNRLCSYTATALFCSYILLAIAISQLYVYMNNFFHVACMQATSYILQCPTTWLSIILILIVCLHNNLYSKINNNTKPATSVLPLIMSTSLSTNQQPLT